MRRRLLLTLAFVLLWAPLAAPAAGQSPVVHRIAVTGTVENGLAPYVARSLREAEAAGAAAAYLDIDTPGGRVDAGSPTPSARHASRSTPSSIPEPSLRYAASNGPCTAAGPRRRSLVERPLPMAMP